MAYRLPVLLAFCLICLAGIQALTCGCSKNSSFCGENGRCNATEVGEKLKNGLKVAKGIVEILEKFPEDQIRGDLRNELCRKLSSIHQKTDLFLLDYADWEPACVRIGPGPRHTCSMAPRDFPKDQLLTKETLTKKLREIHEFLGCQAASPIISEDFHICRDRDLCNLPEESNEIQDIFEVEEEAANPQQLVETSTEASVAQASMNYVIFIIIGVVAFLIVFLTVLAFVCYRFSVWKVVYRVSDKKEKLKQNENVIYAHA